jgi:hypothetical protein
MSSIYSRVTVSKNGEITGQMFAADAPKIIRVLEILLDDRVCAETFCDLPGVNNGKNGFSITLPLGQMRFAPNARLSFRDKATGHILERPQMLPPEWHAKQLPDPTITGYVDQISDEGRITGWVWAPAAPRERLLITVMADDKPAVSTIACYDRGDLRDAGIGDGKYGFDCVLPWEIFAHQRQIRVSVRATPLLVPFGKSVVLRRDQGARLEDSLIAAEAELNRTRAELAYVCEQMRLKAPARGP